MIISYIGTYCQNRFDIELKFSMNKTKNKIRELELKQIENTFLIMEFYWFSLQLFHKVPFSDSMYDFS